MNPRKRGTLNKTSILRILTTLTILTSLIAAYVYGLIRRDTQVLTQLATIYPKDVDFHKRSDNPLLLEVYDLRTKEFMGYCTTAKAQGWGGPLHIAAIIDPEGTIREAHILDHKETPSFFLKMQSRNFFEQFIGKRVSDHFVLGEDIDTVTQATITAQAVTEAVRTGSHAVGRKLLKLQIKEEKAEWKFGINELILFLLYTGTLFNIHLRSKILRFVIMASAFAFLGYYLNSAISIGNISQIMLGFIPSIKTNMFWWILLGGALLMPLVLKRNLYCSCICPFGVLQEFTTKLSGVNIALGKKSARFTKTIPYFLTWLALAIIFVTANPAMGTYEPFSTFFRLEGMGVQWFILPAVVLGSFIITRFFCRFFCPVGVVLNILVNSRHNLEKVMQRIKQ